MSWNLLQYLGLSGVFDYFTKELVMETAKSDKAIPYDTTDVGLGNKIRALQFCLHFQEEQSH